MRQYEMCEITINAPTPESNWAASAPEAVFTCGDSVHRVKGFVAGEGVYKVRFLPDRAGVWSYTVTGDATAEGSVEVQPAAEGSRGVVRAVGCHFEYQGGGYFYPFGTTIYALMHQSEELYETTMATLKTAPFNKIRFCMFPKHYDFNHNEPRFYPFSKNADGSWNVSEPDFDYWANVEQTIKRLGEMGVQCDLILFHPYDRWGFSKFSREEDGVYLDYLLRRLCAMPNVWWSMSNEYDLIPSKDLAHWEFIEDFLAANDPYHHLIGNHNCFLFWDHSRANITHASVQTKMLYRIAEWRRQYNKPICVDECCYEGNIIHQWGSISGREMTYRFWRVVATGGYCTHGETFYDDSEVLWWARGGVLHGSSPARIAFLRGIVESLPGPIEPNDAGFGSIITMPRENVEQALAAAPESFRHFIRAATALPIEEAKMFAGVEMDYCGRVGNDAFITFYNVRTCSKGELDLPEDRKYKIELIDVWNMTREVIAEGASGRTGFDLPGREGMAVLATAME